MRPTSDPEAEDEEEEEPSATKEDEPSTKEELVVSDPEAKGNEDKEPSDTEVTEEAEPSTKEELVVASPDQTVSEGSFQFSEDEPVVASAASGSFQSKEDVPVVASVASANIPEPKKAFRSFIGVMDPKSSNSSTQQVPKFTPPTRVRMSSPYPLPPVKNAYGLPAMSREFLASFGLAPCPPRPQVKHMPRQSPRPLPQRPGSAPLPLDHPGCAKGYHLIFSDIRS